MAKKHADVLSMLCNEKSVDEGADARVGGGGKGGGGGIIDAGWCLGDAMVTTVRAGWMHSR